MAASEQYTFHNSGQVTGVALGGAHHQITVGPVQQHQGGELTRDLEDVLARWEADQLDDEEQQDAERVRKALDHARAGRLDAARTSLAGVGRWVLDVARRAGATALEKELTALLS